MCLVQEELTEFLEENKQTKKIRHQFIKQKISKITVWR